MSKANAEARQPQVQSLAQSSRPQQAVAIGVESPQGERLAQLGQLAAQSPAAQRLAQLAAAAKHSPRNATQQRMAATAQATAPLAIAQRAQADDAPLQGQFAPGPRQTDPAPPANRTGLPNQLKAGIESLSGLSLDHVRVHYNSAKPAQLSAHAYAQGTDIHLAPGQEKHLPHEAWHVVQQAQGRVKPTLQMKTGVPVNDNPALEREADAMGAVALRAGATADSSSDSQSTTQRRLQLASGKPPALQMVSFLNVKRIANNGNLYMGKSTAGAPSLAHNGGTNWYGPKATAAEYGVAPGGIWRVTANHALNLIDMGTAANVKDVMEETTRRRGVAGLSANLTAVLGNFDFAYAVPNAVVTTANNYLRYATDSFAGRNPQWPGDSYNVDQQQVDNTVALAQAANEIPLLVGSVIQTFAGHNSGNAVQLDAPGFLANPNNYRVLRKDATALDAGFANALLADLNEATLFHGLHVPQGMKFGGWTGTKLEILISDCPNNLTLQGQVGAHGPEADLDISDKVIGVGNSALARAWRYFGGNG